MEILASAKPLICVCARDRARATAFYRDVLGLPLVSDGQLAAVFDLGGASLRVAAVPDFTPHGHTMLGFDVPDVPATVNALREKGVRFKTVSHVPQDELGIYTLPGGKICVAWFEDPDGNVLSVTNAEASANAKRDASTAGD